MTIEITQTDARRLKGLIETWLSRARSMKPDERRRLRATYRRLAEGLEAAKPVRLPSEAEIDAAVERSIRPEDRKRREEWALEPI